MTIKREDFISQIKILSNLFNPLQIFEQSTIFTVIKNASDMVFKYFDGTTYAEVNIPNSDQANQGTQLNIEGKNFLTLLNKLTSENIDIIINPTEFILQTGNNKYSFPNQEIKEYQDNPYTNTAFSKNFTIDKDTISNIVKYNTNALSIDPQQKEKNQYLITQNECIATNYVIISFYNKQFPEQLLLNSVVIKSISGLGDCKVEVSSNNDFIKFTCNNTLIFVPYIEITPEGFEVDSIIPLKSQAYPDTIKINKEELLSSMDRLMIFNGDNKSLIFNFNRDKLQITDVNNHNYEDITYLNNTKSNTNYKYYINYLNLYKECSTLNDKDLEFSIGKDNFICIKTADVVKVIALSYED